MLYSSRDSVSELPASARQCPIVTFLRNNTEVLLSESQPKSNAVFERTRKGSKMPWLLDIGHSFGICACTKDGPPDLSVMARSSELEGISFGVIMELGAESCKLKTLVRRRSKETRRRELCRSRRPSGIKLDGSSSGRVM